MRATVVAEARARAGTRAEVVGGTLVQTRSTDWGRATCATCPWSIRRSWDWAVVEQQQQFASLGSIDAFDLCCCNWSENCFISNIYLVVLLLFWWHGWEVSGAKWKTCKDSQEAAQCVFGKALGSPAKVFVCCKSNIYLFSLFTPLGQYLEKDWAFQESQNNMI